MVTTRSRASTPAGSEYGDASQAAAAAAAAATATPRRPAATPRTKKQGKETLPSLAGKASSAYGGKGKVVLSEGLQADTGNLDMAAAFSTKRTIAVAKQVNAASAVDTETEIITRKTSRKRTPSATTQVRATAQFSPIMEEPEVADNRQLIDRMDTLEDSIRLQREASAQLIQEKGELDSHDAISVKTNSEDLEKSENGDHTEQVTGRTAAQLPNNIFAQFLRGRATTPSVETAQRAEYVTAARANRWNWPFNGVQQLFQRPFKLWMFPLYLLLLFLVSGSLSRYGPSSGERALTSLTSWVSDRATNSTSAYIWKLEKKVQRLEKDVTVLETAKTRLEQSIGDLQTVLPRALVVDKQADGSYKIPDYFWQALKDREDAPTWEKFIAKNKAELDSFVSQSALENKRLVTSEVFIDMLTSNHKQLQSELKDLSEKLERKISKARDEGTKVAEQHTKDFFRHGPSHELRLLAAANLVRNADKALHSVNFFSANLGAVVDPTLSSPTQWKSYKGTLEKIYRHSFMGPKGPNPHLAALERWEEAGDCWCAAPPASDSRFIHVKGIEPLGAAKAQLAVLMPHIIYPKSITVEHIPSQGTLDIASAPERMELWVNVPNGTALNLIVQHAVKSGFVRSLAEAFDRTSAAPYALDETYVLIASWKYDIYAVNHVQTFDVDVDLQQFAVGTNKAVVRARTNYGREYTCLYRVRVTGLVKGLEDEKTNNAEAERHRYVMKAAEREEMHKAYDDAKWPTETRVWN